MQLVCCYYTLLAEQQHLSRVKVSNKTTPKLSPFNHNLFSNFCYATSESGFGLLKLVLWILMILQY